MMGNSSIWIMDLFGRFFILVDGFSVGDSVKHMDLRIQFNEHNNKATEHKIIIKNIINYKFNIKKKLQIHNIKDINCLNITYS